MHIKQICYSQNTINIFPRQYLKAIEILLKNDIKSPYILYTFFKTFIDQLRSTLYLVEEKVIANCYK